MRLGRTSQAIVDATNAWVRGARAELSAAQRLGTVAWCAGGGVIGTLACGFVARPATSTERCALVSVLLCVATGFAVARRPYLGRWLPISIGLGASVAFLSQLDDGDWPIGVVVIWASLVPSLVCADIVSARVRRRR